MSGSAKVRDALEFMKADITSAVDGIREGKPFESMLQREDTDLDGLLEKFDPAEDEEAWDGEYGKDGRATVLRERRKRIAFMRASGKEFREEYDPNVTDVDFMRLMEVPFEDAKYVVDFSIGEMGGTS